MRSWILYQALVFSVVAYGSAWGQSANSTLTDFEADQAFVERNILSGDPASALVASSSVLYTWTDYRDLPELLTSLRLAYQGLSREDAHQLLLFRQQNAESGLAWLDNGILAQSIGRHRDAVAAFTEALQDPDCCKVPYSYTSLGSALLDIRDVTGAESAFSSAVNGASQDLLTLFRVHKEVASQFYDHGHLDRAIAWMRRCATSEEPVARAWALGQEISYAWYLQDREALRAVRDTLEGVIADATPDPELGSHVRMIKHTHRMLDAASGYLEGSSEAHLVLDVIVTDALFRERRFEEVKALLEKWITKYPLSESATWDAELANWALSAHNCYYATLCHLGDTETSAQFYEAFLPAASGYPEYEVHGHAWLGFCLGKLGRLNEAASYFEMADNYTRILIRLAPRQFFLCSLV